jgi:hypothetical protein
LAICLEGSRATQAQSTIFWPLRNAAQAFVMLITCNFKMMPVVSIENGNRVLKFWDFHVP